MSHIKLIAVNYANAATNREIKRGAERQGENERERGGDTYGLPGSPGVPETGRKSPHVIANQSRRQSKSKRHRKAQIGTGRHRETQADTGRLREIQGDTGR